MAADSEPEAREADAGAAKPPMFSMAFIQEFKWSFRHHRKRQLIFLLSVGFYFMYIMAIFPFIEELQSDPFAEFSSGDLTVTLEANETSQLHDLAWERALGATGYVVIRSDTPFTPASFLTAPGSTTDLSTLNASIPDISESNVTLLLGENSTAWSEDLSDETQWFLAVLPFQGNQTNATFVGASDLIDTESLKAVGAYDAILESPAFQGFLGGDGVSFYEPDGFISVYVFGTMAGFLLIYPLIVYSALFVAELDRKSIDVLLATPLTRTELFLARNAALALWSGLGVILWTGVTIVMGLAIMDGFSEVIPGVIGGMAVYWLFFLAIQGLGAMASTVASDNGQAMGIAFAAYVVMYVLNFVSLMVDQVEFLQYFSLFYYFDHISLIVDGEFPLIKTLIIIAFAALTFTVGLMQYKKRDLAS